MGATPAHSVAPMCWAPAKRRTNFLVGVGWVHCVAQTVQWIKSPAAGSTVVGPLLPYHVPGFR